MSYITKSDLTPPFYPEIIDLIIRNFLLTFATLADFPATGVAGYTYKDNSANKLYMWSLSAYLETAGPDAIINTIIASGIEEVKAYLNRFNVLAIFGDDDTAPTYSNEHLKTITKDVIAWQLVKLSNPNVNLELFRTCYEDAIKYLTRVMKGDLDPNYPLIEDTIIDGFDVSGHIAYTSNPKMTNHY